MISIPKINNFYANNMLNVKMLDQKGKVLERKIQEAEKASVGFVANFLNSCMEDFFNSLVNTGNEFDDENEDKSESLDTEDNSPNRKLLEHLTVEFGNILAKSPEMKQIRDMITVDILSPDDRNEFKKLVGMEAYYGR